MLCPSQAIHFSGQQDNPSRSHLAGVPPASQWLLQKCGPTFSHGHEGRSQSTLKDNSKQFLPNLLVIVLVHFPVLFCFLVWEEARDRWDLYCKASGLCVLTFPAFWMFILFVGRCGWGSPLGCLHHCCILGGRRDTRGKYWDSLPWSSLKI